FAPDPDIEDAPEGGIIVINPIGNAKPAWPGDVEGYVDAFGNSLTAGDVPIYPVYLTDDEVSLEDVTESLAR
ncbi:MAG: hypothetical protein AAF656_02850, partial [Planctomycetota bacterium]